MTPIRIRQLAALLLLLLPCVLAAQEDPLVLTATQSTTLRPDKEGDPGWIPNEVDMMIYGPKNANPNFRGVVLFDLKNVPKTPPVQAAVLKLTFYKLSGVRNKVKLDIIRVHRMLRPWDEKSASWNKSLNEDEWINKGGDFEAAPLAATSLNEDQTGDPPPTDKPVEFDVTSVVQAWQAGTLPNYGLILLDTDNDSTTNARPYSRRTDKDELRPKLTLHWAQPPKHNSNWLKVTSMKPVGNPVTLKVSLIASLKQGRLGEKFDDHIKAKGGCAPYTFKVTGAFPEGLTLTPEGNITGTPTKEGKYPLNISITDSVKNTATGKTELVVVVPDKGGAKPPDKAADAGAGIIGKKEEGKADDKKPAAKKVDDE
jgi:hypothetical protein